MRDDVMTEMEEGLLVRVTPLAEPGELGEWDRLVAGVPLSDITQLSGWSAVRAEAGFAPLHVFVHRSGDLVGGAQIFSRRIPAVGSVSYLSGGPLVADGVDDRAGIVRSLASAMHKLLGSGRRVLFVQPPADAEDISAELASRGFRASQAGIAPAATLRIDLRADTEALRSRLSKRLRGWTRRWPDKGVQVRLGGEDDLPLLARLVARSAEFQGYEPLSLGYLRLMYRSLLPTGSAVLFVGDVHGEPVAVDFYTRCGGVLRDRLIGFDRNSQASNLSVPAALKWYAMLWAKEQGIRWFDFGGIRVENARALLEGRSLDQATAGGSDFFKISFGGEPFLMPPAVEDARPRTALLVYDLAQRSERGRAFMRKLQRRLRGGARTG
jgi:Acetyltransferase (GNAT) domain